MPDTAERDATRAREAGAWSRRTAHVVLAAGAFVFLGAPAGAGQRHVGQGPVGVGMRTSADAAALALRAAVERFAPVLVFDSAHVGLPMSAQVYFDHVLHPLTTGGDITWVAPYGWRCDGCRELAPGEYGMTNDDFGTLARDEVPTYYRVTDDADGPGEGRLRIVYTWFYGWQGPCNRASLGRDGAHHGDWQEIVVTTSPDRAKVDYVTYYFHGNHYTRAEGVLYRDTARPVAYIGRCGHGAYHDQWNGGWGSGLPLECCDYADARAGTDATVWQTGGCLVDLDADMEPWMGADRIGQPYRHSDGQTYAITFWRWGPHHDYRDWDLKTVHETACGAHPTTDHYGWDMPSCESAGCDACANDACVYPECLGGASVKFDQPWRFGDRKRFEVSLPMIWAEAGRE